MGEPEIYFVKEEVASLGFIREQTKLYNWEIRFSERGVLERRAELPGRLWLRPETPVTSVSGAFYYAWPWNWEYAPLLSRDFTQHSFDQVSMLAR